MPTRAANDAGSQTGVPRLARACDGSATTPSMPAPATAPATQTNPTDAGVGMAPGQSAIRNIRESLKRLHQNTSGATAMEYIMILALVVLPIAALTPMFVRMVKVYAARMSWMQLPFP